MVNHHIEITNPTFDTDQVPTIYIELPTSENILVYQ